MGAALQIIVIPVLLMIALIIIGMWADFSLGTILVGAIVLTLLIGSAIGLLRFEWRMEKEEGLEEESDETEEHPSGTRASDVVTRGKRRSKAPVDIVEECGEESFPASDPPAWTLGAKDKAR